MTENRHPGEMFQETVLRGLGTVKSVVDGVSNALRISDGALSQLDDAMNPTPIAHHGENPEDTFLGVMATIRATMEEARQTGSAKAPNVVQRSREILKRVNVAEPEWRPGPFAIRTAADMFRIALRDLRASESLINLATGKGGLNDLEGLVTWTEEISDRLDKTQKIIAEPKSALPKEGVREKGVTDEEVIRYQKEEIVKELLLLDKHLQQGCKIHGVACDCCEKHPVTLQALAEETYGMTGHSIYAQIFGWCKKISGIVSAEASASGKYDDQYAQLAMQCREFRKTLMGSGVTSHKGE